MSRHMRVIAVAVGLLGVLAGSAAAQDPLEVGPFVYVLTPGTLRLTHPDGQSQDVVATAGEVLWIPAESHAAENTGGTEVRLLVVELK